VVSCPFFLASLFFADDCFFSPCCSSFSATVACGFCSILFLIFPLPFFDSFESLPIYCMFFEKSLVWVKPPPRLLGFRDPLFFCLLPPCAMCTGCPPLPIALGNNAPPYDLPALLPVSSPPAPAFFRANSFDHSAFLAATLLFF